MLRFGKEKEGFYSPIVSNAHPNLLSFTFDEPIADRPSLEEKKNDAITIDGSISDYQESDIEMMRNVLSILDDDGDEEENIFALDDENKILVDVHPLSVPQVTFDEEEAFDRKNFFDKQDTLHQRSEIKSGIQMLSPKSHREPSQWLLQQLSSETQLFQQATSMSNMPKSRNAGRIDKGSIRANLETKHKHWSKEEDKTLKLAMEIEETQPVDWIKIALDYFNNLRSATQCKNRWKNYLKPGIIRGKWQKHEDEFIVSMVTLGLKWVDIAKGLPGRTGEHVRERYVNVLDDKLKTTSWTPEEDRILFHHQQILGNKWSEIRKFLPGRSDNSIKNRYYNRRNAHLRRLKRECLAEQAVDPSAKSMPLGKLA